MSLLAIGWEPELRGLTTVLIAVGVLMGSVYLVLGTNLGGRLGFLVSLTGLAGWMFLMGVVWWTYGLGLKGPAPTWDPVPGQTVLQGADSLFDGGVFVPADRHEPADGSTGADQPLHPDDLDGKSPAEQADVARQEFGREGWETLDPSSPQFGQASSSASDLLDETETYTPGQFTVTHVYDIGGERSPMIGSFDLLAFRHSPHHVVVEVTPNEVTRAENGRPPATAVPDETQPRTYVYMVRNQGALRLPSIALAFGAGTIFFTLCWLLHRRDRWTEHNRNLPVEQTADVVPAG